MITSFFLLGVFASMLHVISGPDHLAAVTPLVIETKHKVWKIGFFWGLGHLAGMLLISILLLLFKDIIPIEKISNYSEQFVGVILILVGLWVFYKIFGDKSEHSHPHIHIDDEPFIHIHKHEHTTDKYHVHSHSIVIKQNIVSSFGVGVVHGLAGVSHFILLLPILGFNSNFEGGQYIIGFAIGTVIAMTTYAFVIGRIIEFSKGYSNKKILNGIRLTAAVFAIAIGSYWIINQQFV